MDKTCLGYVPNSSSAPRPRGAAYVPILLGEVEQEQRPSGNGDREAIVVGARLCDGEGERAYIKYDPHTIHWTLFLFNLDLSYGACFLDLSSLDLSYEISLDLIPWTLVTVPRLFKGLRKFFDIEGIQEPSNIFDIKCHLMIFL